MPTLKCDDVQRALLETFEEQDAAALEPEVANHLNSCPQCARIAAEQHELDVTLTAALTPPRLSPSFRAALSRRLDAPAPSSTADALPDILHLSSCAILTVVSASVLSDYAPVVLATGTIATVMSHLLLATMRNTLDETAF